MKQTRYRKYIVAVPIYALAFLIFATSQAEFAYASAWGGALVGVGNAIRVGGMAIGALGLAFCGIKYVMGNDSAASQALKLAFMIVIAMGILNVLPIVIQVGVSIGQSAAWDPSSL